jgi:hypothetical protein
MVGAPGFEPGTSCPPDIFNGRARRGAKWREVANMQAFRTLAGFRGRFAPRAGFEAFGQRMGNRRGFKRSRVATEANGAPTSRPVGFAHSQREPLTSARSPFRPASDLAPARERELTQRRREAQYRPFVLVELRGKPHGSIGQACRACRGCAPSAYLRNRLTERAGAPR